MKKFLMIFVIALVGASIAYAQRGGMGGMGSGGPMAGSGMLVVADDGSVLVTEMGMSGGMMGGSGAVDRELINVSPAGAERWRVTFEDGWPMMPATDGDLVVVMLVDDWFMGSGGMGDGGWYGGGMGGGMKDLAADQGTLVALDLTTGQEKWRTTITGDMGSMVQFSPDGSRLYVSAMEMGSGQTVGQGPMNQGDAAGAGLIMSNTITAFDRDGHELWTFEVDPSAGR